VNQKGISGIIILVFITLTGLFISSYWFLAKPFKPTPTPEFTTTPISSPSPTVPTPSSSSSDTTPSITTQSILENLAKKLGVDKSQINLVSIEKVQWGDTSMGCPKPKTSYLQVINSGYEVTIEYQNKQYEYHTDGVRHFVSC